MRNAIEGNHFKLREKSSQAFIEHALVVAWIQFERMHDLFERNQNREKALSILMGLKGGD